MADEGRGRAETLGIEPEEDRDLHRDGGEPGGDQREPEKRHAGDLDLGPAIGAGDSVQPVDRAERRQPDERRDQDADDVAHASTRGRCATRRTAAETTAM